MFSIATAQWVMPNGRSAQRHRRPFWIAILISLMLVSACAPAGTPGSTTTSTKPPPSPTAGQIALAAGTPTSGGVSPTRPVKHAMGETQVPAHPQRVVVLEEGPLNSALALGVKPVGAVTALEGAGFPAYLADRTAGIQTVGTILQPNLETVVALQPDLILGVKSRHEAIYPRLSRIAPTVFTETHRCCWRESFMTDAEALGKSGEARQVMDAYWQRLAELKTKMGDRLGQTRVSVVRFVPGSIYLYQKASYIGTILADAGLPRPQSQDVDEFALQVGHELIPQMGGDVIFVTTYGPPDKTQIDELRSHPLWQQLEAVRQGKVYTVPDEYWMVGLGIISANRVIDDLFTYLAGNQTR